MSTLNILSSTVILCGKKLKVCDLTFSYIPSKQQPEVIFSKALERKQLTYLQSKLGMVNRHAPT